MSHISSFLRALVNRVVWAWAILGFEEELLIGRKSIYNKIKRHWDDIVDAASPKKKRKPTGSIEERLDSVLNVLSCR